MTNFLWSIARKEIFTCASKLWKALDEFCALSKQIGITSHIDPNNKLTSILRLQYVQFTSSRIPYAPSAIARANEHAVVGYIGILLRCEHAHCSLGAEIGADDVICAHRIA